MMSSLCKSCPKINNNIITQPFCLHTNNLHPQFSRVHNLDEPDFRMGKEHILHCEKLYASLRTSKTQSTVLGCQKAERLKSTLDISNNNNNKNFFIGKKVHAAAFRICFISAYNNFNCTNNEKILKCSHFLIFPAAI